MYNCVVLPPYVPQWAVPTSLNCQIQICSSLKNSWTACTIKVNLSCDFWWCTWNKLMYIFLLKTKLSNVGEKHMTWLNNLKKYWELHLSQMTWVNGLISTVTLMSRLRYIESYNGTKNNITGQYQRVGRLHWNKWHQLKVAEVQWNQMTSLNYLEGFRSYTENKWHSKCYYYWFTINCCDTVHQASTFRLLSVCDIPYNNSNISDIGAVKTSILSLM